MRAVTSPLDRLALASPSEEARRLSRTRTSLEAREADLLPAGNFHVVFTLPAEVAAIAFHDKALVYDLLFKTAADTMLTIAADPRGSGEDFLTPAGV